MNPVGGATAEGVDHPHWGPTRKKKITWYDPTTSAAAVSRYTGLDFLRAIRDGQIPPPPMMVLLGMRITEIEPGQVVFECDPDESVYNPIGVVHGGLMCTLADTVAACAVQTTLGVRAAYTSIDLNVSYLRAVTTESGTLRATGLVAKPGRRVAFSLSPRSWTAPESSLRLLRAVV